MIRFIIKLVTITTILLSYGEKVILVFTDLEIYDHGKDKNGSDEVHEVGQVLPVESLSQSSHFVSTSGQQVEQSDNSTLKLSACKENTNKFKIC